MDKLCWEAHEKKGGVHSRTKIKKKLFERAATNLATLPVHSPFRVSTTFPLLDSILVWRVGQKNIIYLYFMLMMWVFSFATTTSTLRLFILYLHISTDIVRSHADGWNAERRRRGTGRIHCHRSFENTFRNIIFSTVSLDIKYIITCWVGACWLPLHTLHGFRFHTDFLRALSAQHCYAAKEVLSHRKMGYVIRRMAFAFGGNRWWRCRQRRWLRHMWMQNWIHAVEMRRKKSEASGIIEIE